MATRAGALGRLGLLPLMLAALADPGGTAAAAGDAARGALVFQKCYACHSVVPGETGLTGPNLAGVVGRPVASTPDFEYSDALAALPARGDQTWTEAALDAFLTDPEEFAPGTLMTFVGLPGAAERADLVAYLRATPAVGRQE